ncbi:hypothetical protein NQ314_010396 [Rhamnusium bicolor]|uniref:Zinc transporter 1 n=1 Tax=Rhamnusium bicolor TaxID=1586634 RepID=A0AAV8XSP5_9CUCU|nr:hypothetical protein NQ314_010396 [Rhamnusium bicolor]
MGGLEWRSTSRGLRIKKTQSVASSVGEELSSNPTACHDKKETKSSPARVNQEKKLKNTFGWARIDVIVMLICCVFLASLCFSIFVEALQTLVHIDHHDEMHHPISVLCIGTAGLLLNGVCYLLIGGYTFHQGSFLYVTESGDVILNKVVVNESIQRGERRLSRTKNIHSTILPPRRRQGLWEMTRDINGCVLVIICALLIFFTEKDVAKYIDPIISLIAVTFIMILSYPYKLLNHFPDIVNVHDLHVWQLTANKVISTVHIIFKNQKVYHKIMEDVKEFFISNGITQVTIQPEFFTKNSSTESLKSNKFVPDCLMACQGEGCKQSHCCPNYKETNLFKTSSKELFDESQLPELKSVKILDNELSSSRSYSVNSSSTNSIKSDEATKLETENNSRLNDLAIEKEVECIESVEENVQ